MIINRPPRAPSGFSLADRLLVLLTLPDLSSAEREQLYGLASSASSIDWEEACEKIDHNDVGPVVFIMAGRYGVLGLFPSELKAHLQARFDLIRRQNEARGIIAAELFQRFIDAGVKVIVLKGMFFAVSVFHEPGYKKMNDLDLLVRFADLPKIRQVYHELGLVALHLLEGGDDEDIDEKKNYHLPAFVSRDGKFVVGTHWSLCSPKRGYLLDIDSIWNRSEEVVVAGKPVLSLNQADVLHHLVVHFHYYKTGLKELADFAAWIRHCSPFNWAVFSAEVEKSGSWTPAFRTLSLVEELYRVGVPADFLARCRDRADRATVRDTLKQVARCELLLSSRSTWSSEIEKAYLQFSFSGRWSDKPRFFLLFWKRMLFPPREVLLRTNHCREGEHAWWWLLVLNAWRTAREAGRNYGLAIFVLLMLKSSWELLSDLARCFLGRPRDRMAELCSQLGADNEQIRKLMDSMD